MQQWPQIQGQKRSNLIGKMSQALLTHGVWFWFEMGHGHEMS